MRHPYKKDPQRDADVENFTSTKVISALNPEDESTDSCLYYGVCLSAVASLAGRDARLNRVLPFAIPMVSRKGAVNKKHRFRQLTVTPKLPRPA